MFHRAPVWKPRILTLAGLTAFIVVGSWGATVASHQIKQIPRGQVATKTAKIKNTILRVGTPQADKDPIWKASYDISGPESVDFQWTTTASGVTAARWVVTNKPYGTAGTSIVKSGPVPSNLIPPPNKPGRFSINVGTFIPKQAPAENYAIRYYVVVIPIDAQKNDLEASSTAILLYHAQAPPTQFPDDMGMNWVQSALQKAYDAFKYQPGLTTGVTYGLTDPVGGIGTGPGIAAFRRYKTEAGPEISMEVTGSDTAPIIYISVPEIEGAGVVEYHWFKYTIERNTGRVVPAADGDQYPHPTYGRPPEIGDTDPFTHDTEPVFGVHWAPVLIESDRNRGYPIEELHRRAQISAADTADFMNNLKQVVLSLDISERALQPWQHVTLRGVLTKGKFPDGDAGLHHTMGYNDGEDAPMGPPFEIHDPSTWPGLDWDMDIRPDPAYHYLRPGPGSDVGVEIEHFAMETGDPRGIPGDGDESLTYWPKTPHYVQAIGRWVIDNGHGYSEIHPPELLAVTHLDTYSNSLAVTATGAWRGGQLTFVANPPPRPAADSRLTYRLTKLDGSGGCDRQDNAELLVEPQGPPDNPNHYLCRLRKTANATLILYDSGVIGMTGARGLKCIVNALWEIKSATASGTVTAGSQPARGAFVFYADNSIPRSAWRSVRVDDQGRFSIRDLAIGKSYRFAVEGSGYSFPQGRVLKTVTANDAPLNFVGNRIKAAGVDPSLVPHEAFTRARGSHSVAVNQQQTGTGADIAQRARAGAGRPPLLRQGVSVVSERAALETLRSILVSFDEPSGLFGVAQNGLGYRERGTVIFRLLGLTGADGKPVPDLSSAYSVTASGPSSVITVNGTQSAGVAGARVRARMILGNEWTGFRTADTVEAVTGYNGVTMFRFTSGARVEEATIDVEVLENPYNPWFLPKLGGDVRLFYPALGAGGARPLSARAAMSRERATYGLEVIKFDRGALGATRATRRVGGQGDEVLRLNRSLERTASQQSATGKRLPAASKPKKLKVVDVR